MFLCPSLILVKHVNGQPEGWGPTHPSSDTVTPCPAPNRSGVIPILSKVDATIVMSVCQAPAAELTFASFLQLFLNFPGGGVYRPLQSRFTGQIRAVFPESEHEERTFHMVSGCSFTLTSLLLDSG